MKPKLEKLEALAKRQYGYFTAKQAIQCGFSGKLHFYHFKTQNWIKIEHGLFRLPGHADSPEADCTRWYLWSRNQKDQPQGVISHESALALHGWGEPNPGQVHLTVPPAFRKKSLPGCVLHKATLNLSAIESRDGFLVTRLSQTLADLRPRLEESGEWKAVVARFGPDLPLDPAPTASQLDTPAIAAEPEGEFKPAAPLLAGAQVLPTFFPKVALSALPSLSAAPAETAAGPGASLDSLTEGVWKMIYHQTARPAQELARRRRREAGFTLVELLVVMTIISVLAAMLLPVLEKSLDAARQVGCASHLKQLGTATNLYCDENAGRVFYDTGVNHGWKFQRVLCSYLDLPSPMDQYPAQPEYKPGAEIFMCPASNTRRLTSHFGFNEWMLDRGASRLEGMKKPSSVMIWSDRDALPVAGNECSCTIKYWSYASGQPTNDYWVLRHRGFANVQWGDFHVAATNHAAPLPYSWANEYP